MGKYKEKISDNSIWITATPPPAALSLPFYVTESGHFFADDGYEVRRSTHDSLLLLYTVSGSGTAEAGGSCVSLPAGCCAVIDCHEPHRYFADNGKWEFLWLHIRGSASKQFFELLYPSGVRAVKPIEPERFAAAVSEVISKTDRADILSASFVSASLHSVFNMLLEGSLKTERSKNTGRYYGYIRSAESFIKSRFAEQLTVEDIMREIPMSKYYFIRMFKRITGTTPYNYLINCRINEAKIMLRTTELSVGEIAERCGFLDTSNFIAQFKKSAGQKPLCYRRYFSP